LEGVPFTVKDIVKTKGVRTTFGAIPYSDNVPDHNAVVARRWRSQAASRLLRLQRMAAGLQSNGWNMPAFVATRSCVNNGRIRFSISRSDAAHNASVSSIDAARVHDLRIMVANGFRYLPKKQL
jgi:Asp-tRNA(Asn)/Glu-tRNA(Gln) amidotransferase A subunit family amidase